MKDLLIIANWKSNKTIDETEKWFHEFSEIIKKEEFGLLNKQIVVCPSFTSIEHAKYYSHKLELPIKLGAQDISPFDSGAYTGEVFGGQIKEIADYVIVGHSERRENFSEEKEILEKKIEMSKRYKLNPVFCVQDENTFIPQDIQIVAYEPVFAIGTGNPDTPENAEKISKFIKEKNNTELVLYGGSVNSDNVRSFSNMPNINGFLIGGASLDPVEFLHLIKNA